MEIYGYARVSAVDQHLDRQLKQLQRYVTNSRNIVTDKQSGKDFDRKGYNSLVGTADTAPLLRKGDMLIIVSLDRLGRNYREIRNQWEHITKNLKADIKVLDMPLLDTTSTNGNSLDGRFIADLVLQILSYNAEKERQNILSRQRQGIEMAKAQGRYLGRPKAEYPEQWEQVYTRWKAGGLTTTAAMEALNLKKTTFYKLKQQYEGK